MATRNKHKQEQKQLLGKKVLFLGHEPRGCTWCDRKTKKGMLVEYQDELFCSERCVVEYAK